MFSSKTTQPARTWKVHLTRGAELYKAGNFEESLVSLNEAIEANPNQFQLYDTRASIYEKLGKPKDALRDARKTIDLVPKKWQGYSRAGRLFLKAQKFDAAQAMLKHALERLDENDHTRREEITQLFEESLRFRRLAIIASTCHIDKLPVEIIAEVCKEVVSWNATSVLRLSAVCRQWRGVALKTHVLWSTFVPSHKHGERKVKLWTERSMKKITSLLIPDGPNVVASVNGLTLFPWTNLRVLKVASFSSVFANLLSILPPKLYLDELELNGGPATCRLNRDDLLRFTDGKMRSLTLWMTRFDWPILREGFESLVTLCVRSGGSGLYETLESLPLLETLKVVTSWSDDGFLAAGLTLNRLTHLQLGPLGSAFLAIVSVPALKSLTLLKSGPISSRSILNLVLQQPNLTNIVLDSCVVESDPLLQLLRASPNLENLGVMNMYHTANIVLEALASPDGEAGLDCPLLFALNMSNCPDVQTGPLVRLVKRRLQAQTSGGNSSDAKPVRIRSLIVDGCLEIDYGFLPWFRENVPKFSCVYMTKKAASWKR